MKKTLSQEFNESAAAAHDAFPEKLKNLVILSTGSETPVYVSPEMAEALDKDVESVKKAVKQVQDDMKRLYAAGIAWPFFPIANKSAKMIALLEKPPGIFSEKYTAEMRALFVLDHELGHHVVKTGFNPPYRHLGEASADAFGALRHIQRFGMDTDMFKFLTKGGSVVLGTSPIHFTASVILRVREVAEQIDITKLTLQETAQLAGDIAAEAQVPPKTLDKLTSAFAPAARFYTQEMGSPREIGDRLMAQDPKSLASFVRETVAVMRANKDDHDIVKTGRTFLTHPAIEKFIKRLGIKLDLPEIPPAPPKLSAQRPSGPA